MIDMDYIVTDVIKGTEDIEFIFVDEDDCRICIKAYSPDNFLTLMQGTFEIDDVFSYNGKIYDLHSIIYELGWF